MKMKQSIYRCIDLYCRRTWRRAARRPRPAVRAAAGTSAPPPHSPPPPRYGGWPAEAPPENIFHFSQKYFTNFLTKIFHQLLDKNISLACDSDNISRLKRGFQKLQYSVSVVSPAG